MKHWILCLWVGLLLAPVCGMAAPRAGEVSIQRSGNYVFEGIVQPRQIRCVPEGEQWRVEVTVPRAEAFRVVGVEPGDLCQLPGLRTSVPLQDVRWSWRTGRFTFLVEEPYAGLETEGVFRVTRWSGFGKRLLTDLQKGEHAGAKGYTVALEEVLRRMQYTLVEGQGAVSVESPFGKMCRRLQAAIHMYIYRGQAKQWPVPERVMARYTDVLGAEWPRLANAEFVNSGRHALHIRIGRLVDNQLRSENMTLSSGGMVEQLELAPGKVVRALVPADVPLWVLCERMDGEDAAETRLLQMPPGQTGGRMLMILQAVPRSMEARATVNSISNQTMHPFRLTFQRATNRAVSRVDLEPRRILAVGMLTLADDPHGIHIGVSPLAGDVSPDAQFRVHQDAGLIWISEAPRPSKSVMPGAERKSWKKRMALPRKPPREESPHAELPEKGDDGLTW